jgi:hypothetical protein
VTDLKDCKIFGNYAGTFATPNDILFWVVTHFLRVYRTVRIFFPIAVFLPDAFFKETTF